MIDSEPVWSVSAVNKAVKDTLEGAFVPFWMGGEVGSMIMHRSGHVYFQMKDDKCQIRVCWFNGVSQCRELGVSNGTLVEVWGNLSVYDVRGEYQFNVKKLRLAGIGSLQQRFEALKEKLAAEGLFDPSRKKPIPALPKKIGVVTSPSGAAIRDFLQILNRRFPDVEVKIYPAQVQGAGAAAQVAAGIGFFNRTSQADVIVVTRGGGSMEDLWCFNEELLARAVAASRIPVISAVGHEIDFTICDFAADLRVPTPSAAAELVIGRHDEIFERLKRAEKDLKSTMLAVKSDLRNRCERAEYDLKHALLAVKNNIRMRFERAASRLASHEPGRVFDNKKQHVDELELRMINAAQRVYSQALRRVENQTAAMEALNPERQLERGYAMVFDRKTGSIVVSAALPGDMELNIRFADGEVGVKTL